MVSGIWILILKQEQMCGQSAEFLKVKAVGAHIYNCALNE
jgi:hypothetical protein